MARRPVLATAAVAEYGREVNAEPRVSFMQVRALCEGLEQLGVSHQRLLASSDGRPLAGPDSWLTVQEFDALMCSAAQLSREPAFGLHWGERAPLAQFEQLVTLAATAPSLRAVVALCARFQPLLASRPEYRFVERGHSCIMLCDVLATSELGKRIRSEFLIAATRRMLQYFGAGNELTGVRLPFPRPPHGAEYERLFGPIATFDQAALRLEFPRALLDRPHGLHDRELHDHLRERVEARRRRALGTLTFAEQTEAVIRAALPKLLSMEEAAALLEVSERSLRRRLAEDATDFSGLVDRVRRDLAEHMLAAGTRSVKEIASEAGYSSLSSFYRAFRRWTGNTPASRRTSRARKG